MMDIYGKTEAVVEWAKTWPGFDDLLKLNATKSEYDEKSLVTNYTDVTTGEPFIDKTAPRRYMFSLNLILSWSDGVDDVNIEAMQKASKLLDWVNDQFDEGNLPDFGDAIITSIETDQNLPALNFVFADDSLAQYTIAARIDYIE